MTVDLHIHSTFSDGTLTPWEIVERAKQRGVGRIAVCDHNVVEGSLAAEPLARAAGLRFVPGVEIDSMLLGADAHILCYGADFSSPELMKLIRDARARLDDMSDRLLDKMLADFPQLSAEEYAAMPMDHRQGGWKLLQYLKNKGLARALKDALPYYDRYGVTYEGAGFRPAEDVMRAIHTAGGRAVLAHPGVTFGEKTFIALEAAREMGVDGVECCYPKHSPELTRRLLDFCAERGLWTTAGSDCHGAFGSADVGETRTPEEALRLWD